VNPLIQFTVRTVALGTGDDLIRLISSRLPDAARAPGSILWWDSRHEADSVLAPVARWALPGVVAELCTAAANDFPALRALTGDHGLLLAGIDPRCVPALLANIGIGNHNGTLATGRSSLHIPLRFADHGPASPSDPTLRAWRVAFAGIDTDTCVVIDDATAAAADIRRALVFLGAPCGLSRVDAENPDGTGFAPAWLIRIPACGTAAYHAWATRGMAITIRGSRTVARPAPATRAIDIAAGGPTDRAAAAVAAQRTWGDLAPTRAPFFAGIRPRGTSRADDLDWRQLHRAFLEAEGARPPGHVDSLALPGLPLSLAVWDPQGQQTQASTELSLLSALEATVFRTGSLVARSHTHLRAVAPP